MAEDPQVFLSYRRDDSADITGRIYDRLVKKFGESPFFRDIDTIPLGVDFRVHIDHVVGSCKVLLAIIGPDWVNIKDASGRRRLEDSGDFVRLEIESALKRGIPVIPLLVYGAAMPQVSELPGNLTPLAYRNAIAIRRDPDFHHDMDRLIEGLTAHIPDFKGHAASSVASAPPAGGKKGDTITVGNIGAGSAVAIGRGASSSITQSPQENVTRQAFVALYNQIDRLAGKTDPDDLGEITGLIQKIEKEVAAGSQVNTNRVHRWLLTLKLISRTVFAETARMLSDPKTGVGERIAQVAAMALSENEPPAE